MVPTMTVSSAYLIIVQSSGLDLQSLVYNVNSIGDRKQPRGAPVFVIILDDMHDLYLTHWDLLVRKL